MPGGKADRAGQAARIYITAAGIDVLTFWKTAGSGTHRVGRHTSRKTGVSGMPRPLNQSVNGSGILDRPLAAFAKASAGPIPLPRRNPGVDRARTIMGSGIAG